MPYHFHRTCQRFGFRIIALLLLCSLFLNLSFSEVSVTCSGASTGTVNTEGLNLREKATTTSPVLISLAKGTTVTILKTKTNSAKEKWYRVSVKVNGVSYKGYVMASYVKKKSTSASSTSAPTATTQSSTAKPADKFFFRYGNLKSSAILYKERSTSSTRIAYLKKKTLVYAGQKKKIGTTTWYRVSTKGLSTNYKGYLPANKIQFQKTTVKSTRYKVAITKQKCHVYKTANGTDTRLGTINKGKDVIILGTLKVGGKKWAKAKTSVGTGYIVYSQLNPVTSTVKSTTNLTATVKKKSYTRRVASLLASNKGTAAVGTTITILGRITVNKVVWYKCSFSKNSKTVTGYIRASSLSLSTEAAFQEALLEFPASYHEALTQLHVAHPQWIFNAVNTGLDWNDVIANENQNGKNTIQSNCPKGGASGTYSAPFSYLSTAPGDYNWETDTYTLRDGTNWYSANEQVIAYYMDPRNFLTEQGIFQFESLSYESSQTEDVVSTMLANTFMSGNYSVTDKATGQAVSGSYSSAFMDAAAGSGVSPYYLVSRVKNEVGSSGSGSTSGTYKGYEGYYNFYNIGANDSATGQAIANGLSWAKSGTTYNRPWTTPYKSIVGGAQYIAGQYIGLGQNTMYTQKFNVVVPTSLYLHQYMTAVTASNSYAVTNYNSYSKNGILDNSYTFYIPVFQNMPATACALPASAGNPNYYLKSLTVKNTATDKKISLNATFNYATNSYSAAVASSVNSITISASAISKYAKVGGTGTYPLVSGTNTIKVTCTAGNGTKNTYTLTIVKQ